MRGEDRALDDDKTKIEETPPRAWGRQITESGATCCWRNPPTCVGKTPPPTASRPGARKHPHVRGEDENGQEACNINKETPPRAWGRPAFQPDIRQGRGNTPTCVGKTFLDHDLDGLFRKHPHVRGEDYVTGDESHYYKETPPRAWGRHQHIVKEREFNHYIHVLRQF